MHQRRRYRRRRYRLVGALSLPSMLTSAAAAGMHMHCTCTCGVCTCVYTVCYMLMCMSLGACLNYSGGGDVRAAVATTIAAALQLCSSSC